MLAVCSIKVRRWCHELAASPNGRHVMAPSEQALMVLDLPSLSKRWDVSGPSSTGVADEWQMHQRCWSADNQLVILWQTSVGISVAVYCPQAEAMVAVHEIKQGTEFSRLEMATAPHRQYAAVHFQEVAWQAQARDPTNCSGNQAVLLNLATGQIDRMFGTTARRSYFGCWSWAPSGLAVALTTNFEAERRYVQIWHAPSASVTYRARRPDIEHVWSPKGDVCILFCRLVIETVLHITESGSAAIEVPTEELKLLPSLSARVYEHHYRMEVSPCSKAVVGTNKRFPTFWRIKQWHLMLEQRMCKQACYTSTQTPDGSHLEQTIMSWCPGVPDACLFAELDGWDTLHMKCGKQSRTLAPVVVPHQDEGSCRALHWSPDGQNLAYVSYEDGPSQFIVFRFYSGQA